MPTDQLLFEESELKPWLKEWVNMPSFDIQDCEPIAQVLVSFASESDIEEFAKLIGQNIPRSEKKTCAVWYPQAEVGRIANKRYIDPSRKAKSDAA